MRLLTGGGVWSSPALADLDGDGVADCVVGALDGKVYALSGRDGRRLWEFETGGPVHGRPALADLDGDGVVDCVVGSGRRVLALSDRGGPRR
jgi:outer membrane protein assembly factor BamB